MLEHGQVEQADRVLVVLGKPLLRLLDLDGQLRDSCDSALGVTRVDVPFVEEQVARRLLLARPAGSLHLHRLRVDGDDARLVALVLGRLDRQEVEAFRRDADAGRDAGRDRVLDLLAGGQAVEPDVPLADDHDLVVEHAGDVLVALLRGDRGFPGRPAVVQVDALDRVRIERGEDDLRCRR